MPDRFRPWLPGYLGRDGDTLVILLTGKTRRIKSLMIGMSAEVSFPVWSGIIP